LKQRSWWHFQGHRAEPPSAPAQGGVGSRQGRNAEVAVWAGLGESPLKGPIKD